MEAAPKRARAGSGSAPDRLSALSDELIHRILFFLPSWQAVHTTVLSKRWIGLWRSMPAIDLDIREYISITTPWSPQYRKDVWGKMENLSTNLLLRYRAPRLDAFRLFICGIRVDWSRDVDRWIRLATEYSPMELNIQLEQLHSGCPALEDLVLWGCDTEFCGLQSDTLKNLVVSNCSSQAADILVIRAPSLASLCLDLHHNTRKNGVLLDTGKFLVKASIRLVSGQLSQRSEAILLGSLFNVRSLEMEDVNAMAILNKEFDKSPAFDNLQTLSLNQSFHSKCDVNKFKALGRLPQKSPNLEKLTLQNFQYDEKREVQMTNKKTLSMVRPVAGPIEFPMLGELRTLLLDECDLHDNFRLSRHFLRSSPNLENLTLQLCELPKVFPGRKGNAQSRKTYYQFQNLARFKCQKLKSTEIIYKSGSEIQGLVNLFLGISGCAPKNTITLTKAEED